MNGYYTRDDERAKKAWERQKNRYEGKQLAAYSVD